MRSVFLKLIQVCLLVSTLNTMSAHAASTVAYDTLGPENALSNGPAWFYGAPGQGGKDGNWVTAQRFVSSASGLLQSITVPLSYANSIEFGTLIQIRDDNNGSPGSILAQVSHLPADLTTISTASFSSDLLITEGHAYWISLAADSAHPLTTGAWLSNALSIGGTRAFSGATWLPAGEWHVYTVDGNVSPLGAARVMVTTVPEASTVLLFLGGLFVLVPGVSVARRRKA
ncbi:MAG: PEP-CTERM sorting domain-containing protein [Burkholderiaceae bacterium]|nr:PEP-CTERM sorting domain-containing protein [Burkholderiaceae bacterium]